VWPIARQLYPAICDVYSSFFMMFQNIYIVILIFLPEPQGVSVETLGSANPSVGNISSEY